jgi:Pyridoxamine 5'-phosphate oxidase
MNERPTLGSSTLPYRTPDERRAVVAEHFARDRDCWVISSHPEHGPYTVPLSFLADGETLLLFTHEKRPSVRNVEVEPRVILAFGGYSQALTARGECAVVPLDAVSEETLARYVAKAGWNPAEEGGGFVALRVTLTAVLCSRSEREEQDRQLWRRGEPRFW